MRQTRLLPTVVLGPSEAHGVALRLAARQLRSEWLEWEDVPWLDEASFGVLEESVDRLALSLEATARSYERAHDVDSADLLSRAEP